MPPSDDRSARPARRILSGTAATLFIAAVLVVVTRPMFLEHGLWVGAGVPDTSWLRLLQNGPAQATATAPGDEFWGVLGTGDTLRSVWTVAWWAHAALHPPSSWYDANIFFPERRSLTYADPQLGAAPWFAPTWWLSGDPVLAYQAALLLVAAVDGGLMYLLVRRWTGSAVAGLVSGLIGTIAPYHTSHLNLLYLYATAYLPASLLAVDAIVAGRRPLLAAIVLAAAVALQGTTSAYAVFLCFLLIPAYAGGVLLVAPRGGRLRATAWIGAALAITGVALVVFYRPWSAHLAEGLFPQVQGDKPKLEGMPLLWFWLLPLQNLYGHFIFGLGVPLLALAALGLLEPRARRRLAAAAIVVVGTLVALGPAVPVHGVLVPNPVWKLLARAVPGFEAQRHSFVSMTMVGVGCALLAGLGTAWLLDRAQTPRARAAIGVLVVAIVVWTLREPIRPPSLIQPATGAAVPEPYRWLAAHGEGGALLEVPISLPFSAVYAYFSTFHWLPTVTGTSSILPPDYLVRTMRSNQIFDAAGAAAFVRDVPVTWVLVHTSLLDDAMRARIASPPPLLEPVATFGEAVLFRVRAR